MASKDLLRELLPSNVDLLRHLVKQRLSEAADEVLELFVRYIEEYMELVCSQSQSRTLLQTAEVQQDSAPSQEPLEQQGCNPSLDPSFSFPLQIKQESAEPKELCCHQGKLQLQEVETHSSSVVSLNQKEDQFLCLVKEVPQESAANREPLEQQGYNSSLNLKFSCPLQIKQEPAEPKEVFSFQEEQQLQEVEMHPSSTDQMNEDHQFPCLVKVGTAADLDLLDGPRVKEVRSMVKQENEGTKEESTNSSLQASRSEDDEARSSAPPQRQNDEDSCEEDMEVDNDSDDSGGSEAAPPSAAPQAVCEETANSSDCATEDSEDEWEKHKETRAKAKNIETPEPAHEESNDQGDKSNQIHSEMEKDAGSEPVCNSPTCDPGSEDKTSDSSDAETEDTNHEQRKVSAVETKQLPAAAAASSKRRSRKKSQQKRKKSSEKQSAGKNVLCPECGKEFFYKSNLYRHIRSHTKKAKCTTEKNLTCSICDKRFAEKVQMDLHMRMHKVKNHMSNKAQSRSKVAGSGGAS